MTHSLNADYERRWQSLAVKKVDSEISLPGFKVWLCHALAASVPSVQDDVKRTHFTVQLWEFNELLHVRCSEQCLAHGKDSVSVGYCVLGSMLSVPDIKVKICP